MSEENKNKSSKGQWHGGQGSIQKDHDHNKYAENYDKIFGKDRTRLTKREEVLLDPLAACQLSDIKKKDK